MVLAYHLVFGAYGFWLPNDPRGSWSDFVRSWELYRAAGSATKTGAHRSLAHRPHDQSARLAAKEALRYPPVVFSEAQRTAIARGFAHAVKRSQFIIYACSIMPTHVHGVIARHQYSIEQVMNQIKGEASKELTKAGLHPFQNTFLASGRRHSPWADDGWDVYLYTREETRAAVAYVRNNPIKDGLPPQSWPFVSPYD